VDLVNLFDNTLVHLFPFNGEFFAVDVNSGSLLSIDEPTYFYLEKLIETNSQEKAFDELKGKICGRRRDKERSRCTYF